jgi:hypothetical protein
VEGTKGDEKRVQKEKKRKGEISKEWNVIRENKNKNKIK